MKRPSKSLVIVVLFLLTTVTYAGGVKVGGGGFAVMCTSASINKYSGYYSLDFLLTESGQNSPQERLAEVETLGASLTRLSLLIHEKMPSLSESFDEYKDAVFNRFDLNKLRIWEPTPFSLVDLDDQNFSVSLPSNCRSDGQIKGIPAVIRQSDSFSGTREHIIYKYIPEIVGKLNESSPLQLSFLIVHEWLWDVSSNVDRNRRVNRLLHSKRIETMSMSDIENEFKVFGFYMPGQGPNPFEDKLCVGKLITQNGLEKIYEKFDPRHSSFNHPLGTTRVQSRKRTICGANDYAGCQTLWQPIEDLSRLSDPFWFFVHGPLNDFPIRIVSPQLLANQGITVRGQGNINCKIVEDSRYNLLCFFQDDLLFSTVTWTPYEDQYSLSQTPLRGRLTNECLRIEYSGFTKVENISSSPDVPPESTLQVETVFQMLNPKF
jgi:hypothetical protein